MEGKVDIVHSRCAGLDVHKETVVACVRLASGDKVSREVRTFETTTSGLLALLAWLTEMGCTHVALEATGIYWRPVWNILSDGAFELVLANAAHIKNVPGQRCHLDRRSVGLWPDPVEFRSGAGDPGTALAAPQAAGPRADEPHPAGPENAGGRQHQAGLRDHRHPGGERPGDDRGAGCRRDRSRDPGRSAAQSVARTAARGTARAGDGSPSFPAAASPWADRCPDGGRRAG